MTTAASSVGATVGTGPAIVMVSEAINNVPRRERQKGIAMTGRRATGLTLVGFVLIVGASVSAAQQMSSTHAEHTDTGDKFVVVFSTEPSPPVVGENAVEVVVLDAADNPVDGVSVTAQVSMPSMKTAAASTSIDLQPMGGGVYRGTARLLMRGRWDVTIVVKDGDRELATKQDTILARDGGARLTDGHSEGHSDGARSERRPQRRRGC